MVGQHSTIAARVQALVLHAAGKTRAEISERTGISAASFKHLLARAKKRGYVVGELVLEEHVIDKNKGRSGRQAKITPLEDELIESIVTKNSTTREYTTHELTYAVNKTLAKSDSKVTLGRTTIYKWLKAKGFNCVKKTTKPGLDSVQMMRRVEFALEVRNWTLDD